ncbi:hypothetical protein K7432_015515 [Basidiobolus ranarum]|uniref:C2H2-type domain-containing protein n=1 Tax=Basidiobolus ranarum TaxID=34480 RepID=A0ABR2VMZ0_9FUNG
MKDDSNSQEQFDCLWKGCDKTFVVLEVLIAHIGQEHIGSGKASYTCEWRECPRNQKPFTKRHKMYNHMRTHTGERPFQCPIPDCGKKFSRPDSLSTHVKTHSNVRPYICPVPGCGKAYYHSRSLRKHIKSHEISRSAHLYSPSYANGNEMPYYNSQPFFRQDDFNIPHDMKYPSEPSFFDTLKPEEMNSMQSHPPHESIGREGLLPPAIGGIDIGSGPFGVNNLQMQQMQASSNMLEPPVIQSHSFSEGDTTGYPSSGISSSLGSDMMTTTIPTQNYYTVASGSTPPFPSQPVFIHSTAPPSMPPTSQQ